MIRERVPPPREAACLSKLYPFSQKGGTVIAGDVRDLLTHRRRLADVDGYRLEHCPGCGDSGLHVHDYRWRMCQVPGVPTDSTLVAVAQALGLEPTRREVVDGLRRSIAEVAALAHRLVPGVRLM